MAAGPAGGPFSPTFVNAGNHALAFGVVDVNDVVGATTLTVDGLLVSAIPEPMSGGLLLAGLAALGAVAGRRTGQTTR